MKCDKCKGTGMIRIPRVKLFIYETHAEATRQFNFGIRSSTSEYKITELSVTKSDGDISLYRGLDKPDLLRGLQFHEVVILGKITSAMRLLDVLANQSEYKE
jgi:hypothetical protein